jgi:hypothetical protein
MSNNHAGQPWVNTGHDAEAGTLYGGWYEP